MQDHTHTGDSLWEILVPQCTREGVRIDVEYHRQWDEFVRHRAGGLTLLKTTTGQWVSDEGVVRERMIPVRIVCSEVEIEEIIAHTLAHYDQDAVLAYRLSDQVKMRTRA